MSFFSKFFNNTQQNNVEQELEEFYTRSHITLGLANSEREAREMIKEGIALSKAMAKKEGTNKLPPNFGDTMLERAARGDKEVQNLLIARRKEGLTDEDCREYWNLHDLQRRMVIWSENIMRTAFVSSQWKDNMTEEESDNLAKQVWKTFPKYGNPTDTTKGVGDDRPLYEELKCRVDRWKIKIIDDLGPEKFKEMLSSYSSLNALIRDEMRKGNL